MTEPRDKARLQKWLQTALELELGTIPPYLVALLSIDLSQNREVSELIRSVLVEEMLHLGLVANVLNAVGATPRISARTIPAYPLRMTFQGRPFHNRAFPINLAPFSPETIETFLKIEEPEQLLRSAELMEVRITVPALTVGAFYTQIVMLIDELAAKGERALFSGPPERQLTPDYYWGSGGGIIVVTDKASANAALDLVISQGEGAWAPSKGEPAANFAEPMQMGHYFRFKEIAEGRRYLPTDDPGAPPSGGVIAVDYGAVYEFRENPKASDYVRGSSLARLNNAFNFRYTQLF